MFQLLMRVAIGVGFKAALLDKPDQEIGELIGGLGRARAVGAHGVVRIHC